ncbi:hypothetical protein ACC687_37875, partial [Rhizobium ruizarguesonis]
RDKRLRLVREKIAQIKDQRSPRTIAEVAYSAGFNDISYFNRSFKDLFDCAIFSRTRRNRLSRMTVVQVMPIP